MNCIIKKLGPMHDSQLHFLELYQRLFSALSIRHNVGHDNLSESFVIPLKLLNGFGHASLLLQAIDRLAIIVVIAAG